MTELTREIEDIIKVGIKTEIEGQYFYSTLAQQVKNPEAKKKIEQLALDEVSHERRLRELYKLHVGKEVADLPAQGLAIFQNAFGDRPLAEADKFRLIELAMEAERFTARHYKAGEVKAQDPKVRMVFSELVAEEDGHYDMLAAEREALRGNINWFAYEGSQMLED
jgi:rubrerythrin